MLIDKDKIDIYFKEVIKFPNWKDHLESNKLDFLKELIRRAAYFCYFQNVTMASVPPEDRKTPTIEEIIEVGLGGNGGVCIHNNGFLKILLKEIGFETFMTSGSCMGTNDLDIHAMCIVKLGDDQLYLIDNGCGLPLEEAIPLHKLPYRGIAAGFRYEYRYCEERKMVQRWQFDGGFFRGKYEDPNREMLRYEFSLDPKDFSLFEKSLQNIFCNSQSSIFLKSPFLFRCIGPDPTEPENYALARTEGRKYILIFGASMVIYDKMNREATSFTSYNDIKPYILKYFPKTDPSQLDKCIGYFNQSSEIFLGDSSER